MPAIKILGDGKYEDLYTGKPVDQYGNKLKTTNTTMPTATAIATENDIQDAIKSMKQAQINSAIASLSKSRDAALSNLATEKATIQPEYYKKRNAEATASQLQAKNFAEFMAQRGGTNSGTSAQAELARNVSLQGNIGALDQQEAADYATNARRVADTQNAYESDLAAAKAGAEANAMQLMIAEMQRQATAQQAMEQFNKSFGLQEKSFGLDEKRFQQANEQFEKTFGLSLQEFAQMKAQQELTQNNWQKEFDANQAWKAAELELAKQNAAISASRASSGGSSSKSLTSAELSALQNQAQNDAYAFVNYLNNQGWNESAIVNEITRKASNGDLDMVDIPKLMRYIQFDRYNFGTK